MNKLSKLLIDFYKSKNIELFELINNDNTSEIFGAILQITNWLDLEYKRSQWIKQGKTVKHRPLELPLDLNIDWVKTLIKLLYENELMNQYFEINGNLFNFKTNISEEEKDIIRKDIFDNIKVEPHYYRRFDNVN